MNVFITGGLGFIGRGLAERLAAAGHGVTLLDRSPAQGERLPDGVSVIPADASSPGSWQDAVAGHDAVINLAGASIFTRWSPGAKKRIHDSRIFVTRNLVDALKRNRDSSVTLISASATGYYGYHGDEELTETDPPGDDFLAGVCREWEAEAMKASESVSRVVIPRFGVVLGSGGGAISVLGRIYRLRLGARLGTGAQWFSWIARDDLASAIIFLMDKQSISGPVNCTSPNPVTNRDLTRALNRAMGTFSLVPPAPAFVLKAVLGEFGDFLLKGQRVLPGRLTREGFSFSLPGIDQALASIFVPA